MADGPLTGGLGGGREPHGHFGSLRATLGAGTIVQGISALAGFAVIPVLVHELGSAEFGVLIVIVALGPWLMVLDGALYPATRLIVGELRTENRFKASVDLLRAARGKALKIMALSAVLLLACVAALPLVSMLGLEGVVSPPTFGAAVTVFALPIIASGPGGLYLGALEGVGRTVVAAVIAGCGPILALPITLAVARHEGGLVALSSIQGLALAAPRFGAWAYWRWRPSEQATPSSAAASALPWGLVFRLALLAGSALALTGVAPMIVSSQLGADAAAAYGTAWRIVAGALLPLGIVTPLYAARLASARGEGWTRSSQVALGHLVRGSLGAGLASGIAVALAGPPVASALTGGEVDVTRSLYVAGGCYVMCMYVNQFLGLAFSGPRGIRMAVPLNLALTVVGVLAAIWLVAELGPAGALWAAAAATAGSIAFWMVVWRTLPHVLADLHVPALPGPAGGAKMPKDDPAGPSPS